MLCSNCGTELQSEADSCSNCGEVQSTSPDEWETCEIAAQDLTRGVFVNDCQFWAKADGPDRAYNAGVSEVFKVQRVEGPVAFEPGIRQACDDLVSKLVANGWEQMPEKGDKWWKHRFRRAVK